MGDTPVTFKPSDATKPSEVISVVVAPDGKVEKPDQDAVIAKAPKGFAGEATWMEEIEREETVDETVGGKDLNGDGKVEKEAKVKKKVNLPQKLAIGTPPPTPDAPFGVKADDVTAEISKPDGKFKKVDGKDGYVVSADGKTFYQLSPDKKIYAPLSREAAIKDGLIKPDPKPDAPKDVPAKDDPAARTAKRTAALEKLDPIAKEAGELSDAFYGKKMPLDALSDRLTKDIAALEKIPEDKRTEDQKLDLAEKRAALEKVEGLQSSKDDIESGKLLVTSSGKLVPNPNYRDGTTEAIDAVGKGGVLVNGLLSTALTAKNLTTALGGQTLGVQSGFGFEGGGVGGSFSTGPGGGFGSFGVGGGGGFGGGFGGIGDLSGTGFMIGMQGGDARSKARQLDNMINQLLAAIAMGNVDMITSALTLCNLKAKTTLIGASLNMVRAMQLYDRNMKGISDKMGQIAGKGTDASANLAQLNGEMNQMSMARQSITNTTRDIMGMVEEISNLESSVYSKKDREAQFYRWG